MQRTLLIILSLALLSSSACRQGSAAAASSPAPAAPAAGGAPPAQLPLAEILGRVSTALGGRDRLAALATVRMTGRLTSSRDVDNAAITVDKKRGGKYLRRLVIGKETVLAAVDGEQAWEVDAGAGIPKPQPMDALHARRYQHRADLTGPLVDSGAKRLKVELAGQEAVGGAPAYRLKVVYADGDLVYYLVDAKTFLPLRQLDVLEQRGKTLEIATTYKDFRKAGGVIWPYAEETEFPNFSQRITWSKVEVDVPIDDAEFKLPR